MSDEFISSRNRPVIKVIVRCWSVLRVPKSRGERKTGVYDVNHLLPIQTGKSYLFIYLQGISSHIIAIDLKSLFSCVRLLSLMPRPVKWATVNAARPF